MELTRKEKKPIKQKDVVRLEELQSMHPGQLNDADRIELEKLTLRRNLYGNI